MADPALRSYRQVNHDYQDRLETLIETGEFSPFFLWHFVLFIGLSLSALLIPQRRGTRFLRPLVLCLTTGVACDVILRRRSLLGGNGYMPGLLAAWWTIWCGTLLVFNDPERDFERIERRRSGAGSHKTAGQDGNAAAKSTSKEPMLEEHLVWQPYPQGLSHRLNWALGLLFNMRGPEWNWRLPTMDALPPSVQTQLGSSPSVRKPKPTTSTVDGRSRLRAAFMSCLKAYLVLDVVKVLAMRDPYFFTGTISPPPPAPFPISAILPDIPWVTHLYRLFLAGIGIFAAMSYVTAFNPIIFLGLSLKFPNAARCLTAAPLDAPWLYPATFGSFLPSLLDHGLAGCWAQWWHQLFRFGFTSCLKWLLSHLPTQLTTNRIVRRTATVVIGFGLSGLVHACGSYTQIAETRPIRDTCCFFLLQAVGIIVQDILSSAFLSVFFPSSHHPPPRWLRRTANVLFVFAWLVWSGPLVVDDFARSGLFLTEPLPVSLLRGVGLGTGTDGEGWWCWEGAWMRVWDGGSFWERGIRIM